MQLWQVRDHCAAHITISVGFSYLLLSGLCSIFVHQSAVAVAERGGFTSGSLAPGYSVTHCAREIVHGAAERRMWN